MVRLEEQKEEEAERRMREVLRRRIEGEEEECWLAIDEGK